MVMGMYISVFGRMLLYNCAHGAAKSDTTDITNILFY